LQTELNEAKSRLAAAERAATTREAELAKLRSAASAADSRPTISATDLESARRAASDAEQKLAAANRELTTLREQIAARPADAAPANGDELAKALAAKTEAETKLATSLRSYSMVAQERDALQARVNELASKFSVTTEALTSAEAQAKAATQSATQSVASTAELETLRNRAAAAERAAEVARTELAHANQLLGAYRPTRPEPTRPTVAPAGEPARTHTITPGETLSSISQRYYGTTNRWADILAANRDVLVDERSFAIGRTLRIP
jgi:LysM repeat protein